MRWLLSASLLRLLIQVDFDLKGNGQLQPKVQRNIFAHVDGEIDEVLVTHGSKVKANDVVARMKNRDLEVELANLVGQKIQAESRLKTINYQINSGRLAEADKLQLSSDKAEVEQQISNFGKQIEILRDKERKLQITSPLTELSQLGK